MAKKKGLNDNEKEMIKKLTLEGKTQAEIGDMFGVSSTTIYYYQKKFNLKASNRWHFGESAERLPDCGPVKVHVSEEEAQTWVQMVTHKVLLNGRKTGFDYEIENNGISLTILTGYSDPFEIDIKDLVAFGNELLDVAETLCKLKLK
ncbi:hypothetical protein [Pseudobutyrivibrio sp.]